MASFISKERLDFLSDRQKAELSKHFMKASTTAMPHQLAVILGIEYSKALAILTVLEVEGLCQIKLLVYHNCELDTPIDAIPFGKGFPNLPWICPNCGTSVDNYDELSFNFIAYSKQQIEFV